MKADQSFKKLSGMISSLPSMEECVSDKPVSPALEEMKLGVTSATRRDPQPNQGSLGMVKSDGDKKVLSPGIMSLMRKKSKPTSEAIADDDMKAKEDRAKYYIASGKAHMDSHLAHAISGHVKSGEMPQKHQMAHDAHKAACDSHSAAQAMMKGAGLGAGEELHDQHIIDHEKMMMYHNKKLGFKTT